MSRAENLAILNRVAAEMGADAQMVTYLSHVMRAESGGDRHARNMRSSATGLFQFISSTWDAYSQPGDDIYDPEDQCRAVIRMARDNEAVLHRALGRDPTAGEFYLAHFAGPDGARRLLTEDNLDRPISEIMGDAAMRANAPIRFRGKPFADFTVRDIRAWSNGVMHGSQFMDAQVDIDAGDEDARARRDQYGREFLRDNGFEDGQIDTMFSDLGDAIYQLIAAMFMAMLPPNERAGYTPESTVEQGVDRQEPTVQPTAYVRPAAPATSVPIRT
jgi:hypothetical protein